MNTSVVFPGQGSQKPGMGKSIYDASDAAKAIFEAVSAVVKADMTKLCFESDEAELRKTSNSQLALFTVSLASWAAFEALVPNFRLTAVAGHSVGEYSALVCAGVLSLEDGAMLVQKRGQLMQESAQKNPGCMAAIIGMMFEGVEALCKEASRSGLVVPANDNCPGQIVISGDQKGVDAAIKLAQEKGAKAIKLNVSGGFHSPLMSTAANNMRDALFQAKFLKAKCPVISNVTAKPEQSAALWLKLLTQQIESPVRWRESVLTMDSMGVARFFEFGSGEVLTGLLKRILPQARGLAINDQTTLERAVAEAQG